MAHSAYTAVSGHTDPNHLSNDSKILRGLSFDYIVFAGIGVLIIFVIATNWNNGDELRWLDCQTTFDSVSINKPQNRGAFENVIGDSLVFWSGYSLFDQNLCNSKELRRLFWGDNIISCSISDVKLPFIAYKPNYSDTLYVIRNGLTVFFRVPCDMNKDH